MKHRLITLMAVLACVPAARGMTLKASIEGNQLRWENVHQLGGDEYTPSFWHVVNGLRPTAEWVPGGLTAVVPNEVTLTGGGPVTLPLVMKGFEYNTGAANPTENTSQSGTICAGSFFANGIVKVSNEVGCLYPRSLVNSTTMNPYAFIRPVVEIDRTALFDAFVGKAAGRYIGTLPVGSFYDYYLAGVRSRHHENYQIRFEFDFVPAVLNDVSLTGSPELTTRYAVGGTTVSGETVFTGMAGGWFTNGLNISLNPARSSYDMQGPNLTSLPYSIECPECSTPLLVDNGVVNTLQTSVSGTDTSSISFRIRVSFDDVELDTLENGNYADTFYLLFEAGI